MRYIIELETDNNIDDITRGMSMFGEIKSVKKKQVKRTNTQNASIHLWCEKQAEQWNDAGYDMVTVLKAALKLSWSKESVKEIIWKKVQKAILQKESTTKLNTDEVSKVYDQINRGLSENKIPVEPFPSQEELHYQSK